MPVVGGGEGMAAGRRDDPTLAGMSELLRPFPWRSFSAELLARTFLAAKDRQELAGLLAGVPRAGVGGWEPLEPADRSDPRVSALVRFLAGHRWDQLSLPGLCGHLLAVLGRGG
jgi:hypothetical protein